jgi:NADPH:quinone reductase-like Zn-dependent oxidoreductase
MLAVTLTSFGGPSAITATDTKPPLRADGDVLVRIDAAAIGAWDVQTSQGAFAGAGGLTDFPQVLGWDFAATVVEPDDDGQWAAGDEVMGFSPQPWSGRGVFAEQAALPAGLLARRPDGLAAADAAALPVSLLTADLAVGAAGLGTGSTVLVVGAAGGVGGYVVQLAKRAGATVIASVSAEQSAEVKGLGADHTVDRAGDVTALVRELAADGVDSLVDLVGPAGWAPALGAVSAGGRFVTSVPVPDLDTKVDLPTTVLGVQPNPDRLVELAGLVVDGSVRQRSPQTVPLATGDDAIRSVAERGAPPGKVVLVSG